MMGTIAAKFICNKKIFITQDDASFMTISVEMEFFCFNSNLIVTVVHIQLYCYLLVKG